MGTLTGTYLLPDGTPETGTVTFRLTGRVVNTSSDNIYTEGPVGAELDGTGSFTIDLVAVDDPGFDDVVTDLAYEVVDHVSSRPSTVHYIMPTGTGPWDLEDLVWYDAPPNTASLPVPGPPGEKGDTGPQGPQGIPGEVQNADIWVPGFEALSPLITGFVPATGQIQLGGVEIGDTGWRDISGYLLNGWTATHIRIRRVGAWVGIRWYGLSGAAATSNFFIDAGALGAHWYPINMVRRSMNGDGSDNTMTWFQLDSTGGKLASNASESSITNGRQEEWFAPNDQSWPTTLPGTQVTPPASGFGSGTVTPSAIVVWEQTTPTTSVTIDHNLNAYPVVLVIDDDNEVLEVDVIYNSPNQVTLKLQPPATFVVHFNT